MQGGGGGREVNFVFNYQVLYMFRCTACEFEYYTPFTFSISKVCVEICYAVFLYKNLCLRHRL